MQQLIRKIFNTFMTITIQSQFGILYITYKEKVTGTQLQLVLTLDEFLSNLHKHAVYQTENNSSHIVSSLDTTIV